MNPSPSLFPFPSLPFPFLSPTSPLNSNPSLTPYHANKSGFCFIITSSFCCCCCCRPVPAAVATAAITTARPLPAVAALLPHAPAVDVDAALHPPLILPTSWSALDTFIFGNEAETTGAILSGVGDLFTRVRVSFVYILAGPLPSFPLYYFVSLLYISDFSSVRSYTSVYYSSKSDERVGIEGIGERRIKRVKGHGDTIQTSEIKKNNTVE